jgi:hypothetical protein
MLGPNLQATVNCVMDIRQGLILRVTLADASGDRRTFHDPDAVFISIDTNEEFHGSQALRG